jgi:hypothetical protein
MGVDRTHSGAAAWRQEASLAWECWLKDPPGCPCAVIQKSHLPAIWAAECLGCPRRPPKVIGKTRKVRYPPRWQHVSVMCRSYRSAPREGGSLLILAPSGLSRAGYRTRL